MELISFVHEESAFQLKVDFAAQNLVTLRASGACDTLLLMCESLPFLQRYVERSLDMNRGSTTSLFATSVESVVPKARFENNVHSPGV